jgi:hypothetical protein
MTIAPPDMAPAKKSLRPQPHLAGSLRRWRRQGVKRFRALYLPPNMQRNAARYGIDLSDPVR